VGQRDVSLFKTEYKSVVICCVLSGITRTLFFCFFCFTLPPVCDFRTDRLFAMTFMSCRYFYFFFFFPPSSLFLPRPPPLPFCLFPNLPLCPLFPFRVSVRSRVGRRIPFLLFYVRPPAPFNPLAARFSTPPPLSHPPFYSLFSLGIPLGIILSLGY